MSLSRLVSAAALAATAAAAFAVLAPLPAAAAGPAWSLIAAAQPTAPSARRESAFAYSPLTGYNLLFGGLGSAGADGDTWSFNHATYWSQLHPAGEPPPRYGAVMAWDPADGYFVLFGGAGASGTLADTWTFKSGEWSSLPAAGAPPARSNAAMAYDRTIHAVIMFGGTSNAGASLGDTWMFRHGSWSMLSPGTSPAGRGGASMAFDAADNYVLLFGGTTNFACVCGLADSWEFDGSTWHQLSPSAGPSSRYTYGLAYDPKRKGVVLFGGWHAGGGCGNTTSDTWQFAGGQWTQLSPSSAPVARAWPAIAFDGAAKRLVLFGGWTGTCGAPNVYFQDTWEL